MERIWTNTISPDSAGQTVGAYLKQALYLTQAQIRSLKFRENGICVCGQRVRVTYILREGDFLQLRLEDERHTSAHLIPTAYPLTVLYEDADLIAVWKPAGVVTHPSHGHYRDSMANYLQAYLAGKGETVQLSCIGRLDADTSDILVFAKHQIAAARLWRQKQRGEFQKEYLALCEGSFSEKEYQQFQTVSEPIAPVPGEKNKMHVTADGAPACTCFQALPWNADTRQTAARLFGEAAENSALPCKTAAHPLGKTAAHAADSFDETAGNPAYTLVRLRLKTGRTHQIRVHMAYLGHPLADDPIYGSRASGQTPCETASPHPCATAANSKNQTLQPHTKLCAWKAWLNQPFSGEKILL